MPPPPMVPATASASGDPDVRGRLSDPGDGCLPGTAATAAATAPARTRLRFNSLSPWHIVDRPWSALRQRSR